MKVNSRTMVVLAASGLLLGGCAAPQPYPVYGGAPPPGYAQRTEYGVIESIDLTRDGATTSGLGAVLGGVAGGVIGHQIGSGRGNTAATIAGAIGGALVGNEVEKSRPQDRYRLVVRLDSGATIAVSEVDEGQLRVGDRVRVVNNRVYRS
jgi:outer membrane lipoprotein SlyB